MYIGYEEVYSVWLLFLVSDLSFLPEFKVPLVFCSSSTESLGMDFFLFILLNVLYFLCL